MLSAFTRSLGHNWIFRHKMSATNQSRKPKTWQSALAVALLVGLAALNFVGVFARAPEFGELSSANVTLSKPIELIRPSGKGAGGPWASVQADSLTGRIDNLCFLSECGLPAALSGLRTGDPVRLWMHGNRIWQVAQDGVVLLSYDQILGAYHRAAWRRGLVFGGLFIATMVVLGWIFLRRRQSVAARGMPKATTLRMSWRIGATRPSPPSDYRGMTVNERLVVAGLIDQFDSAARRRDRDAMIALLDEVGLSASTCAQTVELILGNPSHYGF